MNLPINKIINKDWIEAAKELPDKFVHCIITSPPYWGQRNYGVNGQLGLEKTPDEHIEKLVAGFRELRRVLRDDGTLWVNYGDKYAGSGCGRGSELSAKQKSNTGSINATSTTDLDLEGGNLLGLAWRLALALQADGWILRSDIIWAKGLSFCESYSGSVMPESVNGWRWERCRVKVKDNKDELKKRYAIQQEKGEGISGTARCVPVEYQDCPGCPKCEPNGGYVLRKGSWRPTKGHEYLFQFAKQQGYFCDMESIKETADIESQRKTNAPNARSVNDGYGMNYSHYEKDRHPVTSRNLRDVWVRPQTYMKLRDDLPPEKREFVIQELFKRGLL